MLKAVVAAACIALAWLSVANNQSDRPASPGSPARAAPARIPTVDKSPAAQQKRAELIKRLIAERVFYKVDQPAKAPRVHVAPLFFTLDFDTKQSFISVVYAYHYDGADKFDFVWVLNGQTNKPIGTFNLASGLQLD